MTYKHINRVIEGELSCMDKDLNFILNNSIEYHGLRDDEGYQNL